MFQSKDSNFFARSANGFFLFWFFVSICSSIVWTPLLVPTIWWSFRRKTHQAAQEMFESSYGVGVCEKSLNTKLSSSVFQSSELLCRFYFLVQVSFFVDSFFFSAKLSKRCTPRTFKRSFIHLGCDWMEFGEIQWVTLWKPFEFSIFFKRIVKSDSALRMSNYVGGLYCISIMMNGICKHSVLLNGIQLKLRNIQTQFNRGYLILVHA